MCVQPHPGPLQGRGSIDVRAVAWVGDNIKHLDMKLVKISFKPKPIAKLHKDEEILNGGSQYTNPRKRPGNKTAIKKVKNGTANAGNK